MINIKQILLSGTIAISSLALFNNYVAAASYPNIQGRSAAVYDVNTGKTLYQKDANTTFDLASSSKLMTAYLVMEKIKSGHSWNEQITVTDSGMIKMSNDASWGKLHFKYGDKITVREAYELMLLPSANEAAEILGRWATGSDSAYVQKSNQIAKQWGMNSAVFVNASGVDNSDSYDFGFHVNNTYGNNRMSANDAEKMATNILKQHPEIINTTKKTYTTYKGAYYVSHVRNTFGGTYTSDINHSIQVDGLKNGFTNSAENTYITTAYKNNHRLVAVILKSGNMWDRDTVARDANNLLVSGFNDVNEQNNNDVSASKIKVGDLVQVTGNAWAESNGYNLVNHRNWQGTVTKVTKINHTSNSDYVYHIVYKNGQHNDYVLAQDINIVSLDHAKYGVNQSVKINGNAWAENNGYNLVNHRNWMGKIISRKVIVYNSQSQYEYYVQYPNGQHNDHVLEQDISITNQKFNIGDQIKLTNNAWAENNGYNLVNHRNWVGTVTNVHAINRKSNSNYSYTVRYSNGQHNDYVLEQDLYKTTPKYKVGQQVQLTNNAWAESNGYNLVNHRNWIGTVKSIKAIVQKSNSNYSYTVQYSNGEHNDYILEQDLK